jgi:hypothetical protein
VDQIPGIEVPKIDALGMEIGSRQDARAAETRGLARRPSARLVLRARRAIRGRPDLSELRERKASKVSQGRKGQKGSKVLRSARW